jgi:hypothetical protein
MTFATDTLTITKLVAPTSITVPLLEIGTVGTTDTSIARVSAGKISVEGVTVADLGATAQTFAGAINGASGTVGAPGFAWSADADGTGTGLYRPAANQVGFAINGVNISTVAVGGLSMLGTADLYVNTDGYACYGTGATYPCFGYESNPTPDTFRLSVATASRGFEIVAQGNEEGAYNHAQQTDPTLFIHSATAAGTATNQWLGLTHDQTNGVITTGTGGVSFGLSGAANAIAVQETAGQITFEGSSSDTIETRLAVADPTGADKTITLPNVTGSTALVICKSVPNASTTGTSEEVLGTCTLPANTMSADGDTLNILITAVTAANANTRQVRFRFGGIGGAIIYDSASTSSNGQVWISQSGGLATRISSTEIRSFFQVNRSAKGGTATVTGMGWMEDTATVDFSISNDLVVTATTPTAAGDFTLNSFVVLLQK